MAGNYPEWNWHNDETTSWQNVTVHVMADALHDGSSVLEGIRSHVMPSGLAILYLRDPHHAFVPFSQNL